MTDFAASRLGYGTSALVGGRTRREAVRLLEVAYDAGIRHFDTARLYGSGDAEAVLGEFLAGKDRDSFTVATKFGLRSRAPRGATLSAARSMMRRSKRLLRFARRHAGGAVVVRAQFTPSAMEASLEESLKALRLDALDLFLLHDCTPEHWEDSALEEALGRVVERGLVRRIGTATDFSTTRLILGASARRPHVVQFEENAALTQASAIRSEFGFDRIVTHGVFRAGAGLAAALAANASGVVLFSSSSAERIAANARAAALIA